MNWHALNIREVCEKLSVDSEKGLQTYEAKKRKDSHGKNTLTERAKSGFFKKLLVQFSDFMVIVLLIAAAVSFVTAFLDKNTDYIDSVIILGIVIVNSVIGVLQEIKAERAIESLKRLSTPFAKVIRDSRLQKIQSDDVVPGDILVLSAGDLIPADARLLEARNLSSEESSLTGESFESPKSAELSVGADSPVADWKNMLFATCSVTSGNAVAVVVETGMNTQVGKIASLINQEINLQTPLQKRLINIGKIVSISSVFISAVIFILGMMQGAGFLEMFMVAISLAVAAIPEGLPATVTLVLATGVWRMAKKNMIVRKLTAVETLGHANVICSDKTGTLTMNRMEVMQIRGIEEHESMTSPLGNKILSLGALCNNSVLTNSKHGAVAKGEPTENALVLSALKHGIRKSVLEDEYRRINEIPFDSKRKLMTTIHNYDRTKYKIITKGAPDVLLNLCTHYQKENKIEKLTPEIIKKIESNNKQLASNALRVLAVAFRDENREPDLETVENNLIFCGLVGIIDPPRPEAKRAVLECRDAGIKVVMITGDHIDTAKAIAKELQILTGEAKAIIGSELDKLSQKELEKIIYAYSVFARVSPEHKVRIVKAFQAGGAVVAMTGDGVNDAPALKAADIGCAMGKTGTDVAKAASDMIMTDDNFSTIVEAIRQGRGMFDNIKKTIHFLLSTNIGEVVAVLFAFLMRIPTPLLAIHLLWINLVTDSFPAIALGMEPVQKDIMKRKPHNSKKSLFADGMGYNIVIEGFFIAAVGLLSFVIGRVFFDVNPAEPIIGRTMAFTTLSISQLLHAFNVQSKKSIFATGIFSNITLVFVTILGIFLQVVVISIPNLSVFFKTEILNAAQWPIVLGLSFAPLLISEIEKLLSGRGVRSYKIKNKRP